MKMNSVGKKRETTWDVAKAICIIFVVTGHTSCPEYLKSFFYLFHVGVFFYVSGRYLSVGKSFLGGVIWKRFKTLIIPVWIWGLLFVTFHNFFVHIGWEHEEWSIAMINRNILSSMAFATPEKIFLGKWFFPCLFLGSIMTIGLCRIKKDWFVYIAVVILYTFGWYISIGEYSRIGGVMSRILVSVPLLYMGYKMKSWNHDIKFQYFLLVTAFLTVSACFVEIDIFQCKYSFFLALPIYTLLGIVFLVYIIRQAKKSTPYVYNILAWIGGGYTMDILILHVVGFKVLFMILSSFGMAVSYEESLESFWFVFLLAGIFVPLTYVKVRNLMKLW